MFFSGHCVVPWPEKIFKKNDYTISTKFFTIYNIHDFIFDIFQANSVFYS